MKDSPIQIGSIDLQSFEVPPSIRFGGRHRLAVHILSNGQRVVERLGPEDGDIVFEGTFSGPNAEARAKLFDNLRLSGEIVWLTWASFRRRVVVKSFVANYHSPWWIPYHATCTVVYQAGTTPSLISVVGDLISSDLNSASLAVTGSGIGFSALQTSLSSPNALITGTSDQMQAVASVGATLGALDLDVAQHSAVLTSPSASAGNPAVHPQEFAATVDSAGLLATTVIARSYIGRIRANLTGIGN